MELALLPSNWEMNKQEVVSPHNGLLLSYKTEQSSDTHCSSMTMENTVCSRKGQPQISTIQPTAAPHSDIPRTWKAEEKGTSPAFQAQITVSPNHLDIQCVTVSKEKTKKQNITSGVVVRVFNPSTQETEEESGV